MANLDKQIEEQRKATAEEGRAMSARTGQNYQEVDEVPISNEAVAQAEAEAEASEASLAHLDLPAEPKAKSDE